MTTKKLSQENLDFLPLDAILQVHDSKDIEGNTLVSGHISLNSKVYIAIPCRVEDTDSEM